MAHTLGPWIVDDGDGGDYGIFSTHDADAIAYLFEPDGTPLRPGQTADNARVMAAAPELLWALEMVMNHVRAGGWLQWRGEDSPERVAAERALAKAKGEAAPTEEI